MASPKITVAIAIRVFMVPPISFVAFAEKVL
jgi:hypothetical protein